MTDLELIAFVSARLDEKQMHAEKDLWCARRASVGWEAHPGYNLPYSELRAGGQVIARFTGTRGLPLADGEDDQHQADLFLAARMGGAAESRASRALREVEADRSILALLEQDVVNDRERDYDAIEALMQVARIRAAVWSDHPDYRPTWAP